MAWHHFSALPGIPLFPSLPIALDQMQVNRSVAAGRANPRRLLWLSSGDPRDVRQWSGLPYFMFAALEHQAPASGWTCDYLTAGAFDFAARALNKLLHKLGIPIDCRFSTVYAVLVAAFLTIRLLFVRNSILIAVAASNCVAYLRTTNPIIYVSDTTFRAISDLYPAFRAFPNWLKRAGDRNERRTLRRARFVIYTSRWAAASAEQDYGVPADRILEIPFGPNIPAALIEQYQAEKRIDLAGEIVMLFVSADWQRKNGDMVIAVGRALIAAGVNARLVLIGDIPEPAKDLPFADVRGMLRKSDPAQLAALCEAYREAHFLFLPSTADASPVVFSEAQAFGVPSIAYEVGGIGSAVLDGKTGILLPLHSGAEDFAAAIIACARDPERYERLSANCRERYRDEANWDAWARLILRLAEEISARPAAVPARGRLPVR
jgi:glycosyltransferase involved in cell wall biosynthesis